MSTGLPQPVLTLLPLPTVSDSTFSSPLSEVKDADPDDLDDDHINQQPAKQDVSDSSNLSDVHSDPPESEAETDRLFDTPGKPVHHKDVFLNQNNEAKVLERSPSKLQQEISLEESGAKGAEEHPSPPDTHARGSAPPRPQQTGCSGIRRLHDKMLAPDADTDSESRKRKRSVSHDDSDSDVPLRKRTGSIHALDKGSAIQDTGSTDAKNPLLLHSQTQERWTGDETSAQPEKSGSETAQMDPADPADHAIAEGIKSKRRKRGTTRKRKHAIETEQTDGDPGRDPPDEDGHALDETPPNGDVDVDEEAEADITHKNEEELEKKRMAFDQLTEIEKHFATFRDRLYDERLDQLNKEEAMLRGQTPTHPEYLAMMQCVHARLEEKLRYAECHLKHDMESLNTWAVARRGQIMAQFHQGVRASRERVLSELGQQWYEIQHERRRQANGTVDFGIRFPTHKQAQVRHAVAYNTEVSVLAGVAKYQGFPAAPELLGAASAEVEDDMTAITKARQPPSVVHLFHDHGVSARVLGPAGEQFIEQTPWANPNHPSHQVPRAHTSHEGAPAPRRQLSQQNAFSIQGSIPGLSNGQAGHKSTRIQNSSHHHHQRHHLDTPAMTGPGKNPKTTTDISVKLESATAVV